MPIYRAARPEGVGISVKKMGSVDDTVIMREQARATTGPLNHSEYVDLGYAIHMARGTWDYEPVDVKARFAHVRQISLREWLEGHPGV